MSKLDHLRVTRTLVYEGTREQIERTFAHSEVKGKKIVTVDPEFSISETDVRTELIRADRNESDEDRDRLAYFADPDRVMTGPDAPVTP